ncbi:mechanosensitive ion channel domain-containing protein [Aquimarina brevivitae]|uniref:Mechanosensitive ion channel-like protein n=1 Tax=Aquimarina brevivitae TaxID=323412 RepID=A0A4Q7P2H7_9FLAO|nr:mechanosensitive ion channel domain-containing protein [Aquimarina brevivitae]RZS93548.1 mechanosensitive ion channel-like protein [Aquimarina brevivitae]
MLLYRNELLATLILLVVMVLIIFLTKRSIRRFSFIRAIEPNRRKVIYYLTNLITYGLTMAVLAVIWGVDLKEFSLFISSILAVVGIGFVAQWSILSNLTASVILFFSHPVRLGDRIRVLDKDFDWTGEVKDITSFYLFMKTDDGRNITLPTSLVIQKGIEILKKEEKQLESDFED